MLLWPKNLLRLEAAESTPMTTHQQGMNTTTPPMQLPAPLVPGESGGRREEGAPIVDVVAPVEQRMDYEMEEEDPLWFLNTGAYDDRQMMSQQHDSGYDHVDEELDDVPEQERCTVDCKKSLFMQSSQETPPDAASTHGQVAEGRAMLSPNTLVAGVRQGLEGSLPQPKKKQRKRPQKRGSAAAKASSSQSALPTDFEDHVPVKGAAMFHVAGQPILPLKLLEGISGDLRRLHDHVLSTEKSLLASKAPGYPLYAVRVPQAKCYVDTLPADVFFLRFDHIFDMFLTRRLDFTIIRLFALHMNFIIRRDQIDQISVADPYYMHDSLCLGEFECQAARQYIENFMIMNKDKDMVLLPYHPM
jgi:hypothetical protein